MRLAQIDQIYEAIADDGAYQALPDIIASLVGGRSCILFGFDAEQRLRDAQVSHFTPEMIDFQQSELGRAIDIWTSYGMQPHRLGIVGNTDDVMDRATLKRTAFFNESIRRFGDDTITCMGCVLKARDGYMSVAVQRGGNAKPFDAENAATLTHHLPHLFRILDLRARLGQARAATDILQSALDTMPTSVLAVDAGMRVRACNQRAAAMLSARDGLRLVNGRLTPIAAGFEDRLSHAVRSAASWTGAHADAILLPRGSAPSPYRVLISPLARAKGLALVLVDDPAERDPGLADTLAKLYGLTPSEAQLASLLAEGLTPEEAAEARDVRISTVRSQIQSLLLKLEVRRLTDLARLLGRIPQRVRTASDECGSNA